MSVNFESLEIERERFGKEKGQLKGKLRISSKSGDVMLRLNDSLVGAVMRLSKDALIDSVEETANEFIFELTTALDVPALEQGGGE